MYTIFIPKYQGEKTEYLITKVIEFYMGNSNCNCIISSPGYMSTTLNTIRSFLDELGKKMSGKNPCIGFFNGMNGRSPLRRGVATIREEHERQIKRPLKPLHICCRSITDHRKMMFFINYNGSMPRILDKNNYETFLDKCTVCGVLIGSSNQSLGTYFGGSNSAPAKKGEADVLMYIDDSNKITGKLIEFQNENIDIRISRSIDEKNYNNDKDKVFFKGILKNFLENNLI